MVPHRNRKSIPAGNHMFLPETNAMLLKTKWNRGENSPPIRSFLAFNETFHHDPKDSANVADFHGLWIPLDFSGSRHSWQCRQTARQCKQESYASAGSAVGRT
jgi:hypothetical protein